jgi:hypothetical protein
MSSIYVTKRVRFASRSLLIAFISMLGVLIVTWFVNIKVEQSLVDKPIACAPAATDMATFPIVYHQTALTTTSSNAILRAFVEDYIHAAYDEKYVNFHSVKATKRFQLSQLSEDRWKAIEMSNGEELYVNKRRLTESYNMSKRLEKCRCSNVFLIDDILPIPPALGGFITVVVRGHIDVFFDKSQEEGTVAEYSADRTDGTMFYKEIVLSITQGAPGKNAQGKLVNKYGLYVMKSHDENITADKKDRLFKEVSSYYQLLAQ